MVTIEKEHIISIKYLGITIDTKLSWKLHFEEKRKKILISSCGPVEKLGQDFGSETQSCLMTIQNGTIETDVHVSDMVTQSGENDSQKPAQKLTE